MKTFYEWIIEFKKDLPPKGPIARFFIKRADVMPQLKTIDSYNDLLDILDPGCPERFAGFNFLSGLFPIVRGNGYAKGHNVWIEYCEDTGHPVGSVPGFCSTSSCPADGVG